MIAVALALFVLGLVLGTILAWGRLRSRINDAEAGKLSADQDAAVARTERDAERRARDEQIDQLNHATEEKIALVAGTREEFKTELRAISSDAAKTAAEDLQEKGAEARAADRAMTDGALGARAEEIKQAIAPISKELGELRGEVKQLEERRKETEGAVGQMFSTVMDTVGKLQMETGQLVSALKRPQVRGTWGEMQLKNVVKAANMTERVDFHSQPTFEGDSGQGRLRPDMSIHLPTGRDVIVDSKVPLDAYLAANEAPEDERGGAPRPACQAAPKTHLDKLASKGYSAYLETSAEFVICFLPNEAVYCAALDRDPTLLEYGAKKGVLIATPATLLALLYACGYGWQQASIEESARKIAEAGRELHKRFGIVLNGLDGVRSPLRLGDERLERGCRLDRQPPDAAAPQDRGRWRRFGQRAQDPARDRRRAAPDQRAGGKAGRRRSGRRCVDGGRRGRQ